MIFRHLLILLSFLIFTSLAKKSSNFSCLLGSHGSARKHKHLTRLVSFDDYQCRNNRTGEYNYEIGLLDGSQHKEEGTVENGNFVIRGFFSSNADAEVSKLCLVLFWSFK